MIFRALGIAETVREWLSPTPPPPLVRLAPEPTQAELRAKLKHAQKQKRDIGVTEARLRAAVNEGLRKGLGR